MFGRCLHCTVSLWVFTAVLSLSVGAESERVPRFAGLNPSVTVEPFYAKGEMDINVFPLVYQQPLTSRTDLRLSAILNLGIRSNTANAISHFGIEAALPVFLKKKESRAEYSKGFFVSPVVSLTRNRMEKHNNIGLWIEPGYHLLFENKFAMSFGLQTGATYFLYDNTQTKWGSHFGVKIILGRWF